MLHHEYDALKGYRFLGGGHIVLQRFVHVRCHFQPLPTKLVFAYFDRGSPEFSGFHLSMLWIMEQENQKWFHSSWPVSNAQLLKLLQRPQSSRIKSLLGHSQFPLGPAHSLRYAVGHRDPLTRWANVSKCEQTQIMTRLTKNNTIFDIESYILLHRISFHKCQA